MRRFFMASVVAAAVALVPATVRADPPPNDHNCVGVADSGLAGPGFGAIVSGIARSGPHAIADTLGPFANCGATGPR